jgi:hypothetical protein
MIVLAALVPLLTLSVLPQTVQDTSRSDRTIIRLENEWLLAQRTNDTTAFSRLLAPDFTFVGTSGSFRDRAGYVASRSGSWILRADSFEVTELRVRVFGATDIVTGRETTHGVGVDNSARFTHLWLRRQGRWRLVAVQRTDIAPPGS